MLSDFMALKTSIGCGGSRTMVLDIELFKKDLKSGFSLALALLAIELPISTK